METLKLSCTFSTCSWSNREKDATVCDHRPPCELCSTVTLVSNGHWAPVSRLGERSGNRTEHQQSGRQVQSQGDHLGLDQYLTRVSLVHRVGHRSGESWMLILDLMINSSSDWFNCVELPPPFTCKRDQACCSETSEVGCCGSGVTRRGRGVRNPAARDNPPPAVPRRTLTDGWSAPASEHTLTAHTPHLSQPTMDLTGRSEMFTKRFKIKTSLLHSAIVSQAVNNLMTLSLITARNMLITDYLPSKKKNKGKKQHTGPNCYLSLHSLLNL